MFIGISHTSHPKGGGSPASLIFRTGYVCTHSMRNNNQILRVDQTRCEENLHSRPPMLTRDLFAVANNLVSVT